MEEAQYRFTIAYLLACYVATIAYSSYIRREQFNVKPRSLCIAVLLTCLVTFLCLPGLTLFAAFDVPDLIRVDVLRLSALLAASAAIVLLFWTHRSAAFSRESSQSFCTAGPFRWIRHPATSGETLFFLSLAMISANGLLALFMILVVCMLQRLAVTEEHQLSERLGAAYEEYKARTGRLFFKPGALKTGRYSIPRRFGLSAAVTLITTFGFLFGALNYMEAPPAVYLFCAFEIVAICLGQILFGSAPRTSSCVAGALTLPLCVWLTTTRPGWMPVEVYWMCLSFLFFFGGLLGYCLGALAAGFFLVMDLIEPYLPGAQVSGK